MSSKKNDIIEAAISLISSEGYDRSSMESISAQASVSKRTLYKYFPNKKQLLNAIIKHLIEKKHDALSVQYNFNKTIKAQLKAVIQEKVKFDLCFHNMTLIKIIFSELLKEDGAFEGSIEDITKGEIATLHWIKEAQKDGQLNPNAKPIEILATLNELIGGIIFFPTLLEKKPPNLKKNLEKTSKIFLAYYGTNK